MEAGSFLCENIVRILQSDFFRPSVVKDKIRGKSAFFQQVRGPVEFISQKRGIMGVGSEGDNLPAQLPVAADNVFAWIGIVQAVFVSTGVDFQSDVLFDQYAQDLIQNFHVPVIGIILVLTGAVANHVIQMPEHVEVGVRLQILQGALEIFQVGVFFLPTAEKRREVGVFAVHQMDGTDDKIKRIGKYQIMMLFAQIRLEPQLDADGQVDLPGKLFFHGQQAVKIFSRIKFKKNVAFHIIIVHVISQAEMLDSTVNGGPDHGLRRDAAVSGERGMYMVIG